MKLQSVSIFVDDRQWAFDFYTGGGAVQPRPVADGIGYCQLAQLKS